MSSMKRPELLAPAGSREALLAALANGADAVYLGGKQFNARQSAANFSLPELAEAVQLAHRAQAKVYVTVNTLLKDSELEAAVQFLRQLYNIGADAVIVQDPGLIALAQDTTPQLELHASTQLTIHNAAGVNALAKRGIKRVVLARELSGEAIQQIAEASSIGLEIFVHGALCVAYSGQCLLSSLLGGRSGNRGQCAQPCRLPYSWSDEGRSSTYPLSPRDICLLPHVAQLLQLPIDAWKIEGRLKSPTYVGTVVRHYRQAIDRLLAGDKLADLEERLAEVAQVFNRGFSSGYLFGRPGTNLLSGDKPGHRGVKIGQVLPGGAIRFEQAAQRGDVLAGKDGQEYEIHEFHKGGRRLEQVAAGEEATLPGYRPAPGAAIMRLKQIALEQAVTQQLANYEPPLWPLTFHARLQKGRPLVLQASAAGQTVQVSGQRLPEPAQRVAVDETLLARQLGKLGGSGFALNQLTSEIEPGLALPVSEINYCRREAITLLAEKLWGQPEPLPAEVRLPEPLASGQQEQGQQTGLAVIVPNMELLSVALEHAGQLARIYFGTSYHSHIGPEKFLQVYAQARQQASQAGLECYLRLPRILLPHEESAWQAALATSPVDGLLVANWGGIELAQSLGLPFVLDTSLNAYNSWFPASVPEAEGYLLSVELNRAETQAILASPGQRAHLLIHGRHLLMVHEQCLLSANRHCGGAGQCPAAPTLLRDRKGYEFPMLGDATCRSYLYNSQLYSLIDQLHWLKRGPGPQELVIDAELEEPATLRAALRLYLAAWHHGEQTGSHYKQELAALYDVNITRGHWKRGV